MHFNYLRRWCALLLLGLCPAQILLADNVATVGETGYETLLAAFTAAADQQTITLTADIDSFGLLSLTDRTLTLDLNGHTAKGTMITVSGSSAHLTVKDGTATEQPSLKLADTTVSYTSGVLDFTSQKGYIYINQGGSVEVMSGKVMSNYYCPIFIQGNTTTSSGEIKSSLTVSGGYVYARWYGSSVYGRGATVNISGGLVFSGGCALVGNGSTNQGGTYINVSGGTLVSNVADGMSCAIYHPQRGTLNITGGDIYSFGGCGILMRGGTLSMTGGAIHATGDADQTGQVGDSKVQNVPTCGIVFDKSSGYYDAANVKVKISGTASVSGAKAAVSVLPEDDADAKKAVEVYAGTFSSDVTDFLTEAAELTESDGTYTAVTKYLAKVGETKYETLSAACSSAQSGSEVKVLADIDNFGSITLEDKSLTLDLNGHTAKGTTITVSGSSAHLTVKDGTATAAPVLNEDYSVTYASGSVNVSGSLQAVKGGAIDIESGTVKTTQKAAAVIWSVGNTADSGEDIASTVTVSGGYVEGYYYGIAAQGRKATVNVKGGIVLSQAYTINGNGTDVANNRQGGTVTNISGGQIVARNGKKEGTTDMFTVGVYHPQKGSLNISGGEIYSTFGPGVVLRGGTLSMTGGTVTSLGEADFMGSVTFKSENIPTSGIVIDKSANYSGSATMTASFSGSGLKVVGQKAAVSLVGTASEGTVTTTAGTYSSDVTAFCPEDYACVLREDKLYEVGTGVLLTYNDGGTVIQNGTSFTLTDVKDNYLNRLRVTKKCSEATVTLNKKFGTSWTAFAVPFSFTLTDELLNNFAFAEIWDTELDKTTSATTIEYIVMNAGETVSAYTPYLVKALKEDTEAMTVNGATLVPTASAQSQECSTIKQRFTFYATSENTYLLEKQGYWFSSSKQAFVATDNQTSYIAPLSFYLTVQDKQTGSYVYPSTSAAAPKAIGVNISGETTGIDSIEGHTAADGVTVYTLQGTLVGNTTAGLPRGLYIVNGKKTVIK